MLNSCLRDSFIELSHCNRHFAIKGKTSVTFPNFPFPRVIKFLESLSIFTLLFDSVPVKSLGMSLLLPQQYLKNWLCLFYFSSANEVIFLFHVLFDATVGETSLNFFDRRQFFFSCLSLFVLFQAVFVYFELVSDAFLPHQIFSN